MSDAFEKVDGLQHLAIFPLPLVLLPNEVLPLHIFEPRYQQMLGDIQLQRNIFGLSYFDPKETFAEMPSVGSIGCAAEIRETQQMADGRSNILTAGVIRYHLLDYIETGKPYLIAKVEFFEDIDEQQNDLMTVAGEVFELFERVAKAAFDLSGKRGKLPEIQQTDPEHLSFLITGAFNLDLELRYHMLEMRSTMERLNKLRGFLEQAVEKMEENAQLHKSAQTNGHSSKKIDI